VLTADGRRTQWNVSGPFFGGWEIYHVKGSPANPTGSMSSQSSGWFGQVVQRSDDGGRSWELAGNAFVYEGDTGTHQWMASGWWISWRAAPGGDGVEGRWTQCLQALCGPDRHGGCLPVLRGGQQRYCRLSL
jgi:hypothetical protein